MASIRSINRFYFEYADLYKRVKEDYAGRDSSTTSGAYDHARERARARDQGREYGKEEGRDPRAPVAKHPVLHVLESATELGNEQLLNVVHAFTTDASDLLQTVEDDELDAAVDSVYSEHLGFLQAMSNAGVCFSAMLSPTGKCTKPKCPHRHDEESFKYGVLELNCEVHEHSRLQGCRRGGLGQAHRAEAGLGPCHASAGRSRHRIPACRWIPLRSPAFLIPHSLHHASGCPLCPASRCETSCHRASSSRRLGSR